MTFLASPLAQTIGWALLHFIWQGFLVAALLRMALTVIGERRSNGRYSASCAALFLMLLLPVASGWRIASSPAKVRGSITVDYYVGPEPFSASAGSETAQPDSNSSSQFTATEQTILTDRLNSLLPWIVLSWIAGVAMLSLRVAGGWVSAQRLRRRFTSTASQELQTVFDGLVDRLHISRSIKLLQSSLVEVPAIIGWVRPVLLIPVSALTGLTPRQLESIIAHELAHVRRFDYLINLLQTAVETLLFYHPAVWWVSRQIRIERENCCDDVAVSVCGDRLTYARALIELETARQSQLAIAANGGSLMQRVRRVLSLNAPQPNRLPGLLGGFLAVMTIAVVATAMHSPNDRQTNNATPHFSSPAQVGLSTPSVERRTPASSTQPGLIAVAVAPNDFIERQSSDLQSDLIETENPQASVPDQQADVQVSNNVAQDFAALGSSDPATRASAACALGRSGEIAAIPALISLLDDDAPAEVESCWKNAPWTPALQTFKSPSPGEQAAIALASFGRAALSPLIGVLRNANPSARRNAAWAIGEIRGGGRVDRSEALMPLIAALKDSDPDVRKAAAFSLGEMRAHEAIGDLITALSDSERDVRVKAVRALGEMKTSIAVSALSSVLINDHDSSVRNSSAWALGEIRDSRAVEALTIALNDNDSRVRSRARWALSEIRQ